MCQPVLIVPLNEKRFHYYGQVNGEWVPYGNGESRLVCDLLEKRRQEYSRSGQKNEKPLGSGEIDPRFARVSNEDLSALEQNSDDADKQTTYTRDHYYPSTRFSARPVQRVFRQRLLNLDPSVKEEYKKWYIAYKTSTNFVDMQPYQSYLKH